MTNGHLTLVCSHVIKPFITFPDKTLFPTAAQVKEPSQWNREYSEKSVSTVSTIFSKNLGTPKNHIAGNDFLSVQQLLVYPHSSTGTNCPVVFFILSLLLYCHLVVSARPIVVSRNHGMRKEMISTCRFLDIITGGRLSFKNRHATKPVI